MKWIKALRCEIIALAASITALVLITRHTTPRSVSMVAIQEVHEINLKMDSVLTIVREMKSDDR
jgi:hypothetical protein